MTPKAPKRSGSTRPPALLPSPKRVDLNEGVFAIERRTPIVLAPGACASTWESARRLKHWVEATCGGLTLSIEAHLRRDDLGPHFALGHRAASPGVDADAHSISIDEDRVELRGGGASGLRYAVETLGQLLGRNRKLPAVAIEDRPDFALRGVMLDVSRGKVPTLETLKGLVDVLASLKLNTLMLYVEHTFRFRRHPQIGKGASALDAETIRALDDHAAARHVELIPCLQSLGHMDHILTLPRYRELAETEMGWTIAPTHPGGRALIEDLYDEFLPNFRSPRMNANCDEPWDLGRGQSRERSEALGPGGLYLEHVRFLRETAARNGKQTMIWGDVVHAHPKRIPEIPKDLVMLDWWYEAEFDYGRVAAFERNGLAFAVCPGTSSWNSLFPRVENSCRNIEGWAEAGRRHGAIGMLNTDWGDFGHYNLLGNSWFAYAWGAQASWSAGDGAGTGASAAKAEFDEAFSALVFGETGRRGRIAKLYRELGAIHDAGFHVFNGSPFQYLFFDDLERSYFIANARKAALERSRKRVMKVRGQVERAQDCFAREKTTFKELLYAADATLFAIDKTLAARRYNDWRRKPRSLNARKRKKLAEALRTLAKTQTKLLRQLEKLWLERNAVSNLEMTVRRGEHSIKSLRAAATALARGDAPKPVKAEKIEPKAVLEAVRRSLGAR